MSLLVKINLVQNGRELKLDAQQNTTVENLITSVCKKENCDEAQVEMSYNGSILPKEETMADLGSAFLAAPVLDMVILPKMNPKNSFQLSLGMISDNDTFESPRTLTRRSSSVTIRFPIGSWVETKIKGSILIESDNEWCLGKVLEDTETGYLLEIFESYKFLMPPKIEAPFSDVRMARSNSVRLARQKTNDDDVKSAIHLAAVEEPEEKLIESPNRIGNKRLGERHRASQSVLWKNRNKLVTPNKNKRRSWSAGSGNPRRRSRKNILDTSEDYRFKLREYTAKFPHLDPKDLKMYVRIFRSELDKKRQGAITKNKFRGWIKRENIGLEESTINELLSTLDSKDGSVSMDDFIRIMCSQILEKKENTTRELFDKFDLDGDDVISKSELRAGMKSIFEQDFAEDKLTKMIKEADSTGTGSINFKDFCKMMKR